MKSMIKANEYSIGNYITYLDEIYVINGITYEELNPDKWRIHFRTLDGSSGSAKNISWIMPIPLTSEWLERCGFKDIGSCWFHKGEPSFGLLKDNEGALYIGNPVRTYIKTVHHLQNLYFALTEGVELQIKMP